jgi:hypothetical protein
MNLHTNTIDQVQKQPHTPMKILKHRPSENTKIRQTINWTRVKFPILTMTRAVIVLHRSTTHRISTITKIRMITLCPWRINNTTMNFTPRQKVLLTITILWT